MSKADALAVIAREDEFDTSLGAFVAVKPDLATGLATIDIDYGDAYKRYLVEIMEIEVD